MLVLHFSDSSTKLEINKRAMKRWAETRAFSTKTTNNETMFRLERNSNLGGIQTFMNGYRITGVQFWNPPMTVNSSQYFNALCFSDFSWSPAYRSSCAKLPLIQTISCAHSCLHQNAFFRRSPLWIILFIQKKFLPSQSLPSSSSPPLRIRFNNSALTFINTAIASEMSRIV